MPSLAQKPNFFTSYFLLAAKHPANERLTTEAALVKQLESSMATVSAFDAISQSIDAWSQSSLSDDAWKNFNLNSDDNLNARLIADKIRVIRTGPVDTEEKLLTYLLLKEYAKQKAAGAITNDDEFNFEHFRTHVRNMKAAINTHLTAAGLGPSKSIKTSVMEDTVDYLEALAASARVEQDKLTAQQDATTPNSLAARIGHETKDDKPGDGHILTCEEHIKNITARIATLKATVIPGLTNNIREHSKSIPAADNVNPATESLAFANALYYLELKNRPDLQTLHLKASATAEPNDALKGQVKKWNETATAKKDYSEWYTRHNELMERRVSRQQELENLQKQLEATKETKGDLIKQKAILDALKNPTHLAGLSEEVAATETQVQQFSSKKGKRCAAEILEILNPLPTPITAADLNKLDCHLPMLGDDLKSYDFDLYKAINHINHDTDELKDLAAALNADPSSPKLQDEYELRRSQIQDHLNQLLTQLDKYHLACANNFNALQQRTGYTEFYKRLVKLVSAINNPLIDAGISLSLSEKKEQEQDKKAYPVFVFDNNGKQQVFFDSEGKPLHISKKAFYTALTEFKQHWGEVKSRKPFMSELWGSCKEYLGKKLGTDWTNDSLVEHTFKSRQAKEAFLVLAAKHASAEAAAEKRKTEAHNVDDSAHVKVEPGDSKSSKDGTDAKLAADTTNSPQLS